MQFASVTRYLVSGGVERKEMFTRILVPVDRSPLAECVLPHVVAIARAFESQVALLHVMDSANLASQRRAVDPLDWQIRKAEAEGYLSELTLRLQEASLPTDKHLVEGRAAEQIVEFAQQCHADLIVLSSHGQSGLSGWNVSSVVQKIVMRASASIMVVRAYQLVPTELMDLRYQRLLVPLDGSQRAECVLPQAAALALAHQAQITLAHVVPRPEMPRRTPPTAEDTELADHVVERNRTQAIEYLEQCKSRLPGEAQTRVLVSEHVFSALYELADQEKTDLVLLSAHGYSGQTRWLYGSVVISFLIYGATPLLIVQDIPADRIQPTAAQAAVQPCERR
jgi:nucleotide-binding universal stress UspA family protein